MAFQKPHPFLPRAAQSPKFLKWLRRTHAWFGVFGAAAGLLFAVTAITLSHHNFGVDTSATSVPSKLAIPDGTALDSTDALGAFVKNELGIGAQWREGGGRGMGMGGGGNVVAVSFNSPGDIVLAKYTPGSAAVEIERQERGFLGTINRMHQGNGASLGWIIMGDVFAGGLILLSISGFLMWTRMHGSRLLALGLVGFTLISSAFYFSVTA